jgi:hypothetical protein
MLLQAQRRRRFRVQGGWREPGTRLEAVQVFNLADEVVLQVEDAEVPAGLVDQLDALDALLVERDLAQGDGRAVVMLGAAAQQVHCYSPHRRA